MSKIWNAQSKKPIYYSTDSTDNPVVCRRAVFSQEAGPRTEHTAAAPRLSYITALVWGFRRHTFTQSR